MSSSSDTAILKDTFADEREPGHVAGTACSSGQLRRVTDLDGVIGIDHGALRFGYPERAGWGRESLAYGPFERSAGLTFAVCLLNGHHSSQALPPVKPAFKRRLRHVIGPILYRLGLLDAPQNPPALYHTPALKENLAIGWYPEPAPLAPASDGHGLVIHALGPENGELWVCSAGAGPHPVASGIQNIPFYLIIVLRAQGAAYYAASMTGAHGAAGYPFMRPLAVTEAGESSACYAVVSQSTQGEVGFRVESRVYGAGIDQVGALADWCGSAHAADRSERAFAAGAHAHRGGVWAPRSTPFGNALILEPANPTGLIYLRWTSGPGPSPRGAIWRLHTTDSYLACVSDGGALRLLESKAGVSRTLAEVLLIHGLETLLVLDDGHDVRCFAGNVLLLTHHIESGDPEGMGVGLLGEGIVFEAHPRAVPLPATLSLPAPWCPNEPAAVFQLAFEGPAGPLDSVCDWQRSVGRGVFERTGNGRVRVRATRERPNPGRTAYTRHWPDPQFADVEVEIHPPGTARGQNERGRAGLVFWQDAANYFIINTWLDDQFDGTSVSSFHCLSGHEDPFRAVWTNVGRRIRWGKPYRMRARFDGLKYLVTIDNEPVLFRSLQDIYPHTPPLIILRAGLAANWEWGNDTGSVFSEFIMRTNGAFP